MKSNQSNPNLDPKPKPNENQRTDKDRRFPRSKSKAIERMKEKGEKNATLRSFQIFSSGYSLNFFLCFY